MKAISVAKAQTNILPDQHSRVAQFTLTSGF